jgi:hypothetical protein
VKLTLIILTLLCYSLFTRAQNLQLPQNLQVQRETLPAPQSDPSTISRQEHVFIIMTDGFRWQEVFSGADSLMIRDTSKVQDTTLLKDLYWDEDVQARRRKLMPFFWNVIAKQGQLYGNRAYQNKVDMANPYWISYPGYNEVLTGYPDPVFIPNLAVNNRNENILGYLNDLPAYQGKVVAFGSWSVFPYILNEKKCGIPINAGYSQLDNTSDTTDQIINQLENEVAHKGHTRYDVLTYAAAREYIQVKHPAVVFIGFGETDESAHAGRYDHYLQNAAAVDRMIGELWYYVQTDPVYRGKTTFIITTDHGRGKKASTWSTHGFWASGSGQTWMACIGAGVSSMGEIRQYGQIYGKQLAATICKLLGVDFEPEHPVGKAIALSGPVPARMSPAAAGPALPGIAAAPALRGVAPGPALPGIATSGEAPVRVSESVR